MNKVFNPECINFCDRCGALIDAGEIYYAEADDAEIICSVCFLEYEE